MKSHVGDRKSVQRNLLDMMKFDLILYHQDPISFPSDWLPYSSLQLDKRIWFYAKITSEYHVRSYELFDG